MHPTSRRTSSSVSRPRPKKIGASSGVKARNPGKGEPSQSGGSAAGPARSLRISLPAETGWAVRSPGVAWAALCASCKRRMIERRWPFSAWRKSSGDA